MTKVDEDLDIEIHISGNNKQDVSWNSLMSNQRSSQYYIKIDLLENKFWTLKNLNKIDRIQNKVKQNLWILEFEKYLPFFDDNSILKFNIKIWKIGDNIEKYIQELKKSILNNVSKAEMIENSNTEAGG